MSIKRRANARSSGSCTANLSPWEKQLLLSFSTNGKDSTQRLLACITHTDALNTDPDSWPPEVKPHPMKTIYRALISLLECAWTCPVYQQSSLFGIMMSVRKWSFPNSGSLRLATVSCMAATLTTVKTATKIMRPRSDRGGAQTNIEAKRPRIEHY